jgi:hypothetical protein
MRDKYLGFVWVPVILRAIINEKFFNAKFSASIYDACLRRHYAIIVFILVASIILVRLIPDVFID